MTSFDPENHDHDENGRCLDSDGNPVQIMYSGGEQALPEYSLSGYDLIGVGIVGISNLVVGTLNAIGASATVLAQTVTASSGLISREFFAAANYQRTQRDAHANRRLLMEDLRAFEQGERP